MVDLTKRKPLRRKVSMPVGIVVLVIMLGLGGMFGANALYTRHVDNLRAEAVERADREREAARLEQERRWCALLGPLNRAYSSQTPTTPVGQQVATAIRGLHEAFGCSEE